MQYIEIGKIVNIHGIKGEVKLYTYTDDINALKKLKKVYLEKKNGLTEYKVESSKINKQFLILKLEGIDTPEEANKFRDIYVKRERKSNENLGEDTFYIEDLIGIDVYDENSNFIGKLTEVLSPGANDVYVVKNDKDEILLPAIKDVVLDVDLENKKMVVHIMEGLI